MQAFEQNMQYETLPSKQLNDNSSLYENQLIRTFSNPVCKQTYQSLPKIYGKKKKKIKLRLFKEKEQEEEQQNRTKLKKYFSEEKAQHNKSTERSHYLSENKQLSINCYKRKCYCCNCSQQNNNQMYRTTKYPKYTHNRLSSLIFPQIRKFDLSDLQSQHKVSIITNTLEQQSSGLQEMIDQKQKLTKINKYNTLPSQFQSKINKIQKAKINHCNYIKNKYKLKSKFMGIKFQIQQQSSQQNKTDDNRNQRQNQDEIKTSKKFISKFHNDQIYVSSQRDNQQLCSTTVIVNGNIYEHTKFNQLNNYKDMNFRNTKYSQLSNGLFHVPQEIQYNEYLTHYQKLSVNFNMKQLIKSEKFKIFKGQKQVYFGEIDDNEKKNGKGITISQKQIYQGSYQNGYKLYGYQRNIDGIYIGGYTNGLRSGEGIFKWNNGQVFEGNWSNGMKNGFGIWKSLKGDSYEGNWYQNRQHGEGVFKHRISTYKGQFNNFLKDGQGSQIFSNGDHYEGQYREGKPSGKGRYQWHDGGYYDGEFHQGMRQGWGKLVDLNGTIYQGQFRQDFKHGLGKQIQSSGECFQGEFFQGGRVRGKVFWKNSNCVQVVE